jgi:hypothetical protein
MTEGPIEAVKRAERMLCVLQWRLGFAQGSHQRLRRVIEHALWLARAMPAGGRTPEATLNAVEEVLRTAIAEDSKLNAEERQRGPKGEQQPAQPVDNLRPPG